MTQTSAMTRPPMRTITAGSRSQGSFTFSASERLTFEKRPRVRRQEDEVGEGKEQQDSPPAPIILAPKP